MTTQTYKADKNDVTCIYAAKSLAPFLHVTMPNYTTPMEMPKVSLVDRLSCLPVWMLYAGLTLAEKVDKALHPARVRQDRESEEWMRRHDEEQLAEYREDLRKAGIATLEEQMSFIFALGAGGLLYAATDMEPGERKIIGRTEFEDEYTRAAILDGFRLIEDSFCIDGIVTPQGFNTAGITATAVPFPDFEANAKQWLTNEAYAKEGRGEFVFLDKVLMSVDDKNVAWRPNQPFLDAFFEFDFKWSKYCGGM